MPVLFKMYQMEREFKDGRQDNANGKWYARAVHVGEIDTAGIAEIIQRNCSMKKSDVQAVLSELVEVIHDKLAESYAVRLDGIGIFKIGLKVTGATDLKEFSVAENIKGLRVNFLPAYTVDSATGQRTTALTAGFKIAETAKNDIGIEKA